MNEFFGDCNGIRTHNHLVHKRTLNHLAKLVKVEFFGLCDYLLFFKMLIK